MTGHHTAISAKLDYINSSIRHYDTKSAGIHSPKPHIDCISVTHFESPKYREKKSRWIKVGIHPSFRAIPRLLIRSLCGAQSSLAWALERVDREKSKRAVSLIYSPSILMLS